MTKSELLKALDGVKDDAEVVIGLNIVSSVDNEDEDNDDVYRSMDIEPGDDLRGTDVVVRSRPGRGYVLISASYALPVDEDD